MAQETELDPPRKIWPGCYDTGDGFYDPKTLTLKSPSGELLRVPLSEEDEWIKKNCRKAFSQVMDFRPDFYEDWFNNDENIISLILQMQEKYRSDQITFEQLQEFYAEHNLMPSWKVKKTPAQSEREEFLKSIPDPVALKDSRNIEKHAHRLRRKVIVPWDKEIGHRMSVTPSRATVGKKSKSFFMSRDSKASKMRLTPSQRQMNISGSKINFELLDDFSRKSPGVSGNVSYQTSRADMAFKRQVPERFLDYRQVLKAPFDRKLKPKTQTEASESFRNKKKCRRESSNLSLKDSESPDSKPEMSKRSAMKRNELEKYMKGLILEAASVGPYLEAERHRKRMLWAEKGTAKSLRRSVHESQMKFLEEIFESIPEREEYCDSDPSKTCDLKELALDKFQILKYWGTRKFTLDLNL